MNIITPSVKIVSCNDYKTMLEKLEKIGRVCYKSEGNIKEGSAERFIESILRRGHESVIEHESITVAVTCDRGVSHEIVRHRIASYSQESTRYCNYSQDKFLGEITFVDIATGFKYTEQDYEKYVVWMTACDVAEKFYFKLIELGAKPEEARSVLPNSLKTEIVMTMNLREWRHFFRLRSSSRAHPQMREVSDMILNEFVERFPIFFKDIKGGCHEI